MFFEAFNSLTTQGDIAYATSSDGLNWTYQGIALDEPYHLSYPYVFEWQGSYYMIPETFETNSVLLYRANDFPIGWEFVSTLASGRPYLDPSPFYYNNAWWMFVGEGYSELYLFYSDALAGPWIEHPLNPLVSGNPNVARPGGRVLQFDDRLFRIAHLYHLSKSLSVRPLADVNQPNPSQLQLYRTIYLCPP